MKKHTEEQLNKSFKKVDKHFNVLELTMQKGTFVIDYADSDLAFLEPNRQWGYVLNFNILNIPACGYGYDILKMLIKGMKNAEAEANSNEDN